MKLLVLPAALLLAFVCHGDAETGKVRKRALHHFEGVVGHGVKKPQTHYHEHHIVRKVTVEKKVPVPYTVIKRIPLPVEVDEKKVPHEAEKKVSVKVPHRYPVPEVKAPLHEKLPALKATSFPIKQSFPSKQTFPVKQSLPLFDSHEYAQYGSSEDFSDEHQRHWK